jgi:D-aspartate ligase
LSSEAPLGADSPAVVVLAGSKNTLSAARSLGARGVPVHILGDGIGTDLARSSRYVSTFLPVVPAERFDRWFEWLESGPPGAVVLAGGDTGLEFVALHRQWLVERGYRPFEANDDVTLAMLDKSATYELARSIGVDSPRTTATEDVQELLSAAEEIGFPCALKPLHSHRFVEVFGRKAVVVHSPEELRQSFRTTDDAGLQALVTEIVPGVDDSYSSYYSYLDEHGAPLLHFTKRKLRQHPIGFGIGTYHVTQWDPEVAEVGLRFFQGVGLRGIGNVEFKRDRRDDRLKLIECNPRITAADALVRRSGIDLPLLAYLRALGREVDPVDGFRDGVREWYPESDFRAFLAYREAGRLTTARWMASLGHVQHFAIFDRGDLRPSVVRVWRWCRRLLHRVRRGRRRSARRAG